MEIGSLQALALEAADDRLMAMRASDQSCLQAIVTSASPPQAADSDDTEVALVEPYEQYTAKTLRKEVYRLKLKVIRKGPEWNDNKQGYIEMLRMLNKSVGGAPQPVHMAQPAALSVIESSSKVMREVASADEQRLERASASLRDFRSFPLSETLPDDRATLHEEEMGRLNEISPSPSSIQASPMNRDCNETDSIMSLDSGSEMDDGSDADAFTLEAPTPATAQSIKKTLLLEKLRMLQFQRQIQRQEHWERRLTIAKAKLREIQSELDLLPPADATVAALLRQELMLYRRERRRALQVLIKGSDSDHPRHARAPSRAALVLP